MKATLSWVCALCLGVILSSCGGSPSGPTDKEAIEQIQKLYAEDKVEIVSSFPATEKMRPLDTWIKIEKIEVVGRNSRDNQASVLAKLTIKQMRNIGENPEGWHVAAFGGKKNRESGDTYTVEKKFGFNKYDTGWRLEKMEKN